MAFRRDSQPPGITSLVDGAISQQRQNALESLTHEYAVFVRSSLECSDTGCVPSSHAISTSLLHNFFAKLMYAVRVSEDFSLSLFIASLRFLCQALLLIFVQFYLPIILEYCQISTYLYPPLQFFLIEWPPCHQCHENLDALIKAVPEFRNVFEQFHPQIIDCTFVNACSHKTCERLYVGLLDDLVTGVKYMAPGIVEPYYNAALGSFKSIKPRSQTLKNFNFNILVFRLELDEYKEYLDQSQFLVRLEPSDRDKRKMTKALLSSICGEYGDVMQ